MTAAVGYIWSAKSIYVGVDKTVYSNCLTMNDENKMAVVESYTTICKEAKQRWLFP